MLFLMCTIVIMEFINYKNWKPEDRIERFIISTILKNASEFGSLRSLIMSYDDMACALKDNNSKNCESHMCRITIVRIMKNNNDRFYKQITTGKSSRRPCSYELNLDKIFSSKASYDLFIGANRKFMSDQLVSYFNELSKNYSRKWNGQRYS